MEREDFTFAEALFTEARERDPYRAEIYINLGNAYQGQKKWKLAIQMFEKAASFDENNPNGYYNIGLLYYTEMKDYDQAQAYLLKARDRRPNDKNIVNYLGLVMYEISKRETKE